MSHSSDVMQRISILSAFNMCIFVFFSYPVVRLSDLSCGLGVPTDVLNNTRPSNFYEL